MPVHKLGNWLIVWLLVEKTFLVAFFRIRIPVFTVSFLHLDHRLSPQGEDLPKPFPKSILAHTATVLSYNMALTITSIKPTNPTV